MTILSLAVTGYDREEVAACTRALPGVSAA
jgi:hypothetical protein